MHTTQRNFIASITLCAAFTVPGLSLGALIDRGGGLIYDNDLNITWLADANYARTSGYDSDGQMTRPEAITWVNSLSYYDAVRGVTYNDWRLPLTLQPDPSCSASTMSGYSYGRNCTGSELGHMFYIELGGMAGYSINLIHNPNYALFENIQYNSRLANNYGYYWSGTNYDVNDGIDRAWMFHFELGYQTAGTTALQYNYAWAVRDGDVAVVPLPAAAWLIGSGLLGLVGVSRRRK